MKVIESKEMTKVYGKTYALNGITFEIEENKITGIIGRNGAGKTTMLKIIAGLFKETSGEVRVFSEKPFNNLTVSANMIFIDDGMILPASLNLKEILDEAERFYENWDSSLANRLFDYFSLSPNQYHSNLSKGMKSTFNMILGLSAKCPLTIFDEPTTGMDAGVRHDFYRVMLKDYLAYPRTILLSSHHLEEIEDLLEDILLIKDGRVHLHLPVADLKEWAIGLSGKKDLINEWVKTKKVFHEKSIGHNNLYVVVKNDFTIRELENITLSGLDVFPVSSSDLCMYLTQKTKGGIDDVYNKAKSDKYS
ncbi:ABC transporter ATP-binding protein [Peribacillus loiseleuriae]|uniref:ABC transporter n=1 Tax=Peribacillus loiseleuriae TaxID=1679170 RepID=A0A0K9GVY1_9BACI|nr:ABC transporter ATP-binding protein [Peribacillus loiseleuriae]KMY50407.1 ABC transporter [Peribacillus loiseleuriae]